MSHWLFNRVVPRFEADSINKCWPRWWSDDVVDADEEADDSDDECNEESEGVGDSDSSRKKKFNWMTCNK